VNALAFEITDENQAAAERLIHAFLTPPTCAYCGEPWKQGGKRMISVRFSRKTPVHPECYAKYEQPDIDRLTAALLEKQVQGELISTLDKADQRIWAVEFDRGNVLNLCRDTNEALAKLNRLIICRRK